MSDSPPGVATRLASQSGLIVLGNLFTFLAGFPFQIYLAKTLGAGQFGAFGLFEAIAQTATALFGFGLASTLVRFIPEQLGLNLNRHVRKLLADVYSTTLVAGTFAAALLIGGSPYLVNWMPELGAYAHLLPFAAAMTLLGMLNGLSQQAMRAFFDIRYVVLVSAVLQLTLKIAIALLLLWWGWALLGYLIAVVASTALALAGMAWGLRGKLRHLAPSRDEVLPETRKRWWSYARTMYGNSLLSLGAGPVERFLLAGAIDLSAVGILVAIRQLQNIPQVMLQVIITVVAPMLTAAKGRDDIDEVRHLYYISTDWICRMGLPLLVFLLFFGDDALGLYGAAFADAGHWPLRILVAAQCVNLITGPVGNMLIMLGHEKTSFRINVIADSLFFVSLIALTPFLGLLGVALGSALSMVYANLRAAHVMQTELRVLWWSARLRRLLAPLGASIALAWFARSADFGHGPWALGAAFLAVYAVFCLIYLSGGLSREDKEIFGLLRNGPGSAGGRN